ncbi:MAG: Ig-like domain-containing protein [Mogibacterium sp.]|nr:Ig-like domain-containing protein [Mogibacterium sp.]
MRAADPKKVITGLILACLVWSMIIPSNTAAADAAGQEVMRLTVASGGKSLDVTGGSWYLLTGRTAKITVSGIPADQIKSVKYSSSKKKNAKISSKGKVTAKKKGNSVVTVKVTRTDGTIESAKVTIRVINSGFKKNKKYKGPGKFKSAVNKIRKKSDAQGRVIFYGSSSIRKWKTLAKDMSELEVLNHGFGGSTVNDCLYYADKLIIPYNPKAIVFYAGTNDIGFGYSANKIYSRSVEFVKYIHNRLPDTRIYYVSQTKQPKRAKVWKSMKKLNSKMAAYAAGDPLLTYIDTEPALNVPGRSKFFVKDGLHYTSEGYKVWTSVIQPVLYADLVNTK